MGDGEEWDPMKIDTLQPRVGVEQKVERQVSRFVGGQGETGAAGKT